MIVLYDKAFRKGLSKLSQKLQSKVSNRIDIFIKDQLDPILNNHPLHGEYEGCNSINITGDYRAIYYLKGDTAIFIRIGTHTELYS